MSREDSIYKRGRSPVMAYLSLKRDGEKVPLSWAKRQEKSRQKLNDEVARVLQNVEGAGTTVLLEWELIYEKEWFYHCLRCLHSPPP